MILMLSLPQSQPAPRATRVHFTERTPAVLRLGDGRRVSGKLKVVSLTGGLLSVPHPVNTGSSAKLMFLTAAGMVLGSAEMLSPLSWGLQPFRFVALADDDEDRLKTVIQRSVEQKRTNHGQIERSRAW
ncbi:MAG: hypothetical protein WAM13_08505 [Candidatus Sulfotelmatobacter sp.]